MKNKQATTLSALQIGDRFYKSGDAKKTVWTLKKNHNSSQAMVLKDGEQWEQKMKLNAPVVFLRRATESVVTS